MDVRSYTSERLSSIREIEKTDYNTAIMVTIALTPELEALLAPLDLHPDDRLDLDLDDDGLRFVASSWRDWRGTRGAAGFAAGHTFYSRVPESKKLDKRDRFLLAATDITCLLIDQLWPRSQVCASVEAATVVDYHLALWRDSARRAKLFAEWKLLRQTPSHDLPLHPDPELRLSPYQQVALLCCLHSEGYALFMEMGTGKTPVVIARVCLEARRQWEAERRKYKALVICPKNVRANWEYEMARFATEPGACLALRGTQIARVKRLTDVLRAPGIWSAAVCSYESAVNSMDVLSGMPWDLVVVDEGHNIATPNNARTRSITRLRDAARQRMILTGSPIRNTALDLYSQFEFLRKGGSGFMSWKNFKQFYGVYVASESGYKQLVSVQNLPFMRERLARCSFQISLEEALPDLPKKQYDLVEVDMTERQTEVYRQLQRELAVEIENVMGRAENRQLLANNVLTMLLRLAQITSGFVSWDPILGLHGEVVQPREIEPLWPNPKLDALTELIADKRPEQKTIVWCCWKPDVRAVEARLRDLRHDPVVLFGETSERAREAAIRRFNEDRACRFFVGNPGAGGVGVNLLGYPPGRAWEYETDCDHEVFFSQDWSHPKRVQAEARANRRGTRKPTRITDLVVAGTVDEDIRARVTLKRVSALELQDLRELLKKVLNI